MDAVFKNEYKNAEFEVIVEDDAITTSKVYIDGFLIQLKEWSLGDGKELPFSKKNLDKVYEEVKKDINEEWERNFNSITRQFNNLKTKNIMRKNTFSALVALDAILDTIVFGRPLGLHGELATKEELDEIRKTFFGEEEEVEEEEVDLDELVEDYVDIDTTPREAFKMGYEVAKGEM